MRVTLIALACVTLVACGGGDGSDGTTQLITADEGGTIDLGNGTTIEIPANAVTEDVEVTVTLRPGAHRETVPSLFAEHSPVRLLLEYTTGAGAAN